MATVAKRNKLVDDVNRLRRLDTALRTKGVNVPKQAEEWQTTPRAIHRYLDVLRELVAPTKVTREEDRRFLQRYVGKPAKLFAKLTGN